MRKTCGFLLLLSTYSAYSVSMEIPDLENPWYGSIGTGLNRNKAQDWDAPFQETFNSTSLANRGFYTFEIGKQVQHYVDVSLMYLNHATFNYQMEPSTLSNNQQNRSVNLNNQAVLVSGFLHPDHDWYKISTVSLSPFIGGGVGYALNQIDNFYPNGNPSVSSNPANPITVNSFAWQASAGLSIHPVTHLSLDVGYRYYDGGSLDANSNTLFRPNPANSFGLTSLGAGHLSTNQLFVDFKYKM